MELCKFCTAYDRDERLNGFGGDPAGFGVFVEYEDGNLLVSSTTGWVYTFTKCLSKEEIYYSIDEVFGGLKTSISGATYKWLDCYWGMEEIPLETDSVLNISFSGGEFALEITQGECRDTSYCVPYFGLVTSSDVFGPVEEQFKAYPNPTSGIIQMSQETTFTVTDMTGQTVLSGEGVQIDMSGLASGVYFVMTPFGQTKVVKQ